MISPFSAVQIFHPRVGVSSVQEVLEELGLRQGRGRPRGGGAAVHARHRGQAPRLRAGPPRRRPGRARARRAVPQPEPGAVTRNQEATIEKGRGLRGAGSGKAWANLFN